MHFTVNYISKVCKKREKVIVIPFTLVGTMARAIAEDGRPQIVAEKGSGALMRTRVNDLMN